jgi:cell division septation protein DedD
MSKELYVKGYGTGKPPGRGGFYAILFIVLGVALLVGLSSWMKWRKSQERVKLEETPLYRSSVIRPIPPPPADSEEVKSPKPTSTEDYAPTSEVELAMEARAAAPTEESPSLTGEQEGRETAPEARSVDEAGLNVSRAGESAAYQDSKESEIDAKREQSETASSEVIAIQVGTFRRLANAESLKVRLAEKGYDVYLDSKTLPQLGQVYLVRIKGYTSMDEAMADRERLRREEKIDSLIITPGKGETPTAEE